MFNGLGEVHCTLTVLPTIRPGTVSLPKGIWRRSTRNGYTGTSLWIDPVLDRYFVLLTNRAYGGGTLDEMRDVRRAFHNGAASIE